MSSIAVRSVTKEFVRSRQLTVALDDVSVEVPDGSFTCLVGASGCGKSTLLNIMAGLVQPTHGTVLVDGVPVDAPGRDRGMVFQSYALYPWLRVRDNVEFGLSLRKVPRPKRRETSEALLNEMGLTEFANAYPRELSGGMQQRVAIARALANDPKALLMDEPFGALDALTRASAQRFLTEVWERHRRTIVFVTHDVEEAILLADRVVVMSPRPGRVREVIEVTIPRPRTATMVTAPEFVEVKRRILELIFEHASQD
jgi:ABC-type nitrate/sulfonate/bicarbonate transport system ATPase subunit